LAKSEHDALLFGISGGNVEILSARAQLLAIPSENPAWIHKIF
jgi:hypothetical protein